LRNHDQARALADGADHGVGVRGQFGRVVFARQVESNCVTAAREHFGRDEVPVPADVASAVGTKTYVAGESFTEEPFEDQRDRPRLGHV
jgi:hypothetical protein